MLSKRVYAQVADYLLARTGATPSIGMVLGSGLGEMEQAIDDATVIPYGQIPYFPEPGVVGHKGHLVLGRLCGQQVMVMSGRVHFYEGHSMAEVTLPIRVMQSLGVHTLVVTNAAGGLNPAFKPGDLMLIEDHINLVGMVGHNPLWGPNDESLGPRFPDMTNAYDLALRALALQAAQEHHIPLQRGVYAMLSGPSFETPAEIRFLRIIGADAVGMSTAHEVTVARHAGMRVLGVSGISNVAAGVAGVQAESVVTHDEVLEAGKIIVPRLKTLIQAVLSRI